MSPGLGSLACTLSLGREERGGEPTLRSKMKVSDPCGLRVALVPSAGWHTGCGSHPCLRWLGLGGLGAKAPGEEVPSTALVLSCAGRGRVGLFTDCVSLGSHFPSLCLSPNGK